jgi:hypothetical protein
MFIKSPLHVFIYFDPFVNDYKSILNDIIIEGLPKNIVHIVPTSKSFFYKHKIEGSK